MAATSPGWQVRLTYRLVTVLFYLAAAFGLLVIVSITVGLARHGDSLLYGGRLPVPLELSPGEVRGLPHDLQLSGWPKVTLVVAHPTSGQMLLRSLSDVGPAALAVGGLWLGRRFLRDVLDGNPFGDAAVRRLRELAFLILIGGSVVSLADYVLRQALFSDLPQVAPLNVGMEGFGLPVGPALLSLGVFVLAEVFAYGARLREDVEATI
jgi:hypothetical protein